MCGATGDISPALASCMREGGVSQINRNKTNAFIILYATLVWEYHERIFMLHSLYFRTLRARVISLNPRPAIFSRYRFRSASTFHIMDQLKVHNSLQPGPPVPFVPIEKGKISWYVCGPTVYDHSHLGHARNYVATDIIRRILRDYFGFEINFVMNITDVDDKVTLICPRFCGCIGAWKTN
jgi:hypothetical protein